MDVLIVGGFLGSGKTTLLLRIAELFTGRGKKVAIIVNESGEVGVDGATIGSKGYDAVELAEGCICCSLVGSLQATLKEIKRDIDPDIMIIEPTGLALPHKVRQFVHTSMIDEDSCVIIGIADAERFDSLLERKENFYRMQISASDLVLINKIDIVDDTKVSQIETWFKRNYPKIPTIRISAKTGEGMDLFYKTLDETISGA